MDVSQDLHAAVAEAGTSKMLHSQDWPLGKDSWKLDSAGMLMAGSLALSQIVSVLSLSTWPPHVVSPTL